LAFLISIFSLASAVAIAKMKTHYIRSFDGLRGLAVLAVLVFHGSYGSFKGGFLGVDLFFIVSGYLITSLLFEEHQTTGKISFAKFYARRGLRLLPALVLGIVIANILWPLTKMSPTNDQAIATFGALFYSTNLIFDTVTGNLNHLWSLSVEEHFYFAWPFVMAYVIATATGAVRIRFLVLLLLAVTIFRILAFIHEGEWVYKIFVIGSYEFTLCRIDCILLGALLYFYINEREAHHKTFNTSWDYVWLLACFMVFVTLGLTLSLYDPYWRSGGFILTNFICLIIVFLAIRNPDHPIFSNSILVWVGKRSYGIYIYHLPIFLAMEGLRVAHSAGNLVLVTLLRWIVSIGIAALSYEFLEKPLLHYKRLYQVNH
jgi:peptidoglycan/LPS O-acetylase OafA/YrhL